MPEIKQNLCATRESSTTGALDQPIGAAKDATAPADGKKSATTDQPRRVATLTPSRNITESVVLKHVSHRMRHQNVS
ncbi:hypothetical protein ACQP1O_09095 [Nocardia sp. CA-151230]|uniref:hypothetical protein n=1 Tax=Nocardia sp. CA-151230 TaxID=3239982 RepID=UPI003D9055EC